MNDTQIAILSETADFLYQNGVSRNFLHKFYTMAFEAKKNLNKMFGLNESNMYRTTIEINERDEQSTLMKFVEAFCNKLNSKAETDSGKSLTEKEKYKPIDVKTISKSGNTLKLTRLFTKETIYTDLAYMPEFWKLLEMAAIIPVISIREIQARIDVVTQKFGVWYGDQCNGSTRVIVLSSNPLDMLKASVNTSFSSCYRIDGEYWNGCITSALSENTLITSLEDRKSMGYKIGRAWIYIGKEIYVIGRTYGSFFETQIASLRNFIAKAYQEKEFHHDSAAKISNVMETKGPAYLDTGYGLVYKTKNWKFEKIILPQSICLYCGNETSNGASQGVCGWCRNNVDKKLWME